MLDLMRKLNWLLVVFFSCLMSQFFMSCDSEESGEYVYVFEITGSSASVTMEFTRRYDSVLREHIIKNGGTSFSSGYKFVGEESDCEARAKAAVQSFMAYMESDEGIGQGSVFAENGVKVRVLGSTSSPDSPENLIYEQTLK